MAAATDAEGTADVGSEAAVVPAGLVDRDPDVFDMPEDPHAAARARHRGTAPPSTNVR